MKKISLFLIYCFLILKGNSTKSSYDYSSYSGVSTNSDLTNESITSSTAGESAVYITNSGIQISSSSINKSGDISSSLTEYSEFYGINAAILVQGGGLTIKDGTITTSARGGNAVCATNNGEVTISGTTITSTGSASARGLHSTYGGKITASDVTISTNGGSCATLATDRGEGTVTCTGCKLTTEGAGSPLIYSTGEITVNGSTGTANGAQMVVVEGKNTVDVQGSSSLKGTGVGNREVNGEKIDSCGIFLYQSMSGDAVSGTSEFTCSDSSLEILSTSSVYSSAPMFFITNTEAEINLENCNFNYGSGTFLKAAGTSAWGTSGSNGGDVTLVLNNQDIEGDFIVDKISSLTITMVNSSIKGKINTDKASSTIKVNLDSDSTITLTGNSYITSLNNDDSTGSNINKGTYTFADYNGNDFTATGNSTTSDTTQATQEVSTSDTTQTTQEVSTSDTTQTTQEDSTSDTIIASSYVSSDNNTDDENITKIVTSSIFLSYFKYILFLLVFLLL